MSSKPVFAVGHRGAAAYAPENTVASFDEAIRLGAKAVEFDLRMTQDGVPVVLHDETVNRTTNGSGPVSELTRFDLLRLDAGSWMHQRFVGTRIPTLEEALLAIGPHAMPVIELKTPIPPEILLRALRKYDLEHDSLVISFHEQWLVPLRTASRDLPIGLLAENWSPDLPERANALAAATGGCLVLCVDTLAPHQIAAAEARGLEVWCYTANDVGMVAACAAMGITGIITDRPDLIRSR
ncbi:MAG TPA: glycerophosphodiester phosphodiesterase family protein [Phycisphaerae bacterium]|nr:glycerophosphodiester phosphodiesterase family protein [Phycisphaerae bacterium]